MPTLSRAAQADLEAEVKAREDSYMELGVKTKWGLKQLKKAEAAEAALLVPCSRCFLRLSAQLTWSTWTTLEHLECSHQRFTLSFSCSPQTRDMAGAESLPPCETASVLAWRQRRLGRRERFGSYPLVCSAECVSR